MGCGTENAVEEISNGFHHRVRVDEGQPYGEVPVFTGPFVD
ncbi:MAG TPA: hypothetical protein VEM93_05090 [Actinomycetota bacterium]|nr:hypothetical protein [Actinomycetota bacterium]